MAYNGGGFDSMNIFQIFEVVGMIFFLAFDKEYIEEVAYETRTSEESHIKWLRKTGRLK